MSLKYPDGYTGTSRDPHCGVLAVAICAGVSFETAWDIFKSYRTPRQRARWRGATNWQERDLALLQLKVDYGTLAVRRQTLLAFVRDVAKPGETYMVRVRGHVVTVRDGMVIDQTACAPASKHPSRRKFILRVTRITGKKGN